MGASTTVSPLSSTNQTTMGDARSICSSESKSSDPDKTSYRSSNSSLDRLDESNTLNISTNINTLLRNGVPENEIVLSWLREFSYEDYAENFLSNGYDIQTIVRMTPEVSSFSLSRVEHRVRRASALARRTSQRSASRTRRIDERSRTKSLVSICPTGCRTSSPTPSTTGCATFV